MMFRAILAVALFLSGCGGGSPPAATGTIVPITTLRADLKFGYYFGNPLYMVEQADHVNLWWARRYGPGVVPRHGRAVAAGARLRGQERRTAPEHHRSHRTSFPVRQVSEMGYLTGWDSITVYPMDEPDASGLSDART
jgi:hypothetical protein